MWTILRTDAPGCQFRCANLASPQCDEMGRAVVVRGASTMELLLIALDDPQRPDVRALPEQHRQLLAVGALSRLDPTHVELKSMHTAAVARGQGIARALLRYLLKFAGAEGYQRMSLETGSMDAFVPARRLYLKLGFTGC